MRRGLAAAIPLALLLSGCSAAANDCDGLGQDGVLAPATQADWSTNSVENIGASPREPRAPDEWQLDARELHNSTLCAQVHWLVQTAKDPQHNPYYVHGRAATGLMDGLRLAATATGRAMPYWTGPVWVRFGTTWWEFSSGAAVV